MATPRTMTPRDRLVLTARIIAATVLGLAVITAAMLGFLASEAGRAWVLGRINEALAPDGRAGALTGSLFGQFSVADIAFSDQHGDWLMIARADADWRPMSLLAGRVTIDRLSAPHIQWLRLPEGGADDQATPLRIGVPRLPFTLDIKAVTVARLDTAAALTGEALAFTLDARLTLSADELGDSRLLLQPLGDGGGDTVEMVVAIDEAEQAIDLNARIAAPKGGIVNRLTGLDMPLLLRVAAHGPLVRWTGRIDLDSAGLPIAALSLRNADDHLLIDGRIDPSALLDAGNRRSLGGDYQLVIDAAVTTRSVLMLTGSIEGPPGSIAFDGGVSFRDILRFEDMTLGVLPNPDHAAQIGIAGVAITKPRIDAVLNGPLQQPLAQARLAATQLGWRDISAGEITADLLLSWQRQAPRLAIDATVRDIAGGHPALAALAGQKLTLAAEAGMDMETGLIALRHTRLVADKATLEVSGDFASDFGRLDLTIDAQLADLATLRTVSEQPVSGKAALAGQLTRRQAADAVTLALSAAFNDLNIGDDRLNGLAGTSPRLILEGDYLNPENWQVATAALENAPLKLHGKAQADSGVVKGSLNLAHASYGNAVLRLQTLMAAGKPVMEIAAEGAAMGAPLSGRFIVAAVDQGLLAADRINLDWGNFSFTGHIAQQPGGQFAGALDFLLQPGHQASLFGISGDAHGHAALRYEDGVAVVETAAEVKALAYSTDNKTPFITGPGTLSALLRLGDTPQLNARTAFDNVLVAGRRIEKLRYDAENQGAATNFSGEASFGGFSADRLALTGRFAPQGAGQQLLTGQLTGQLGGVAIATRQPFALALGKDAWRLNTVLIDFGDGHIEATARQSPDALALHLLFDSIATEALAVLTGPQQANGDISGQVTLDQHNGRREGAVTLTLHDIRSPRLAKEAAFAISLNGGILGEEAQFSLALNNGETRLVQGVARLALTPVAPGAWPGPAPDGGIDIHLYGETPLAPLWALVPADQHILTGLLAVDINVGGKWGAAKIDGVATLKEARYENLDFGVRLHDISAQLAIDDRHIRLTALTAHDGNGGRLQGDGDLYLDEGRAADSAIAISLDKLRLLRRDDLRATMSGDLVLAGAPTGLALSGALAIERAEIFLTDKGAASIAKVATREINRPAYLEDTLSDGPAALTVSLDLGISARNQLFVQGLGLNAEWDADLTVKGTLDDPRLGGSLSLVRGAFDFATTRFDLTRGELDFDGRQEIDPRLDVIGIGDRDGLTATVAVGGRASAPRITLSSAPPLPEDEILSRLLFGASVNDLSALEAVQLGSALAALTGGSGGAGTLNVLNTARSTLGIDRLTLGTGPSGGTTVTGGKYLTDDVYLEVTTEPSTGESSAVVEWDITRRLSLLSRVKQQSDANFAIRWSRDY